MVRRSPTVQRRRLGMELRNLRESAGMTIEQVATALDCSVSKVSRIETGHVGATSRDVRDMLQLYGVTGRRREALIQVAKEAREKAWWHAYGEMDFSAHVGFEAGAATLKLYHALIIPGLLQTDGYAQAILRALLPDAPPEQMERRLALRADRRRLLEQRDPPDLWTVVDEAVLRRPVGGHQVHHDQLQHLLEAADRPNITLQVLPFAAGAHAGMDGSFTIMTFADPSDPDIVYLEHPTGPLLLDRAADLARYTLVFNHLLAAALPPDDSLAFLGRLTGRPDDPAG